MNPAVDVRPFHRVLVAQLLQLVFGEILAEAGAQLPQRLGLRVGIFRRPQGGNFLFQLQPAAQRQRQILFKL